MQAWPDMRVSLMLATDKSLAGWLQACSLLVLPKI